MSTESAVAAGSARYAGARVHRVEDYRLLTGRGTFVDDVQLAGMLHGCFVRSPHARAVIEGIDTSKAMALEGVHAVFTGADLNPDLREQWDTMGGPNAPQTPRTPLAQDQVRLVGDPVALVIARDRYIAEDAADLVEVDYRPLPAVVDYRSAEASAELVHESHGSNLIGGLPGPPAEPVDEVFRTAAHVVSDEISHQAQSAVPLEGRGVVVQNLAGEITIWVSTQAPHEARAFTARILGVPEHRIRVIARDTGGGFGQKVRLLREEMAVILAAQRLHAPLKWTEDRRENLLTAGKARQGHAQVRMAFDDEGAIQATQIDYVEDDGAYPSPFPVMLTASIGSSFPGPYRVPKASFTTKAIYTNTVGRTAYRAPWAFESLAREVVLDQAARQMGIDPIELRRRNLLRAEEMPYTAASGAVYNHITPLENFEQAIAALDLDAFRAEQAAARAAGRYIGVGTCSFVEPTTPGMGTFGTEAATIRIEPSGKVNIYMAGGSTGNSLETTAVQLTADALGVDIADVTTIHGDTALSGYGAGTGGSRSGSMIAGAVEVTASVLRERIVAIAAHRLEAAPDDIQLEHGRASVRGTPTQGLTLAEIANLAYFQPGSLPPHTPPGLEASGRYKAASPVIWANASHVCTCEVDPATGAVTLLRYIVSENCGAMINPNIVEGQIAGGTVQGIASALYEHLAYDSDGNPLTTTLMDYVLPTAAEIPDIEYAHYDTPGPGPGGYKGIGEGGAIGGTPAAANAVADALAPFNVRTSQLPLSPAAILDLLHSARSAPG
jgi:carbon-monoxide dehydrogenase large subunit